MDKSILILDTPKCCIACPFQITECNFNICIATRNDSLKFISEVSPEGYKKLARKPDWCPLKPFPKKLELSERDAERVSNGETVANSVSFKAGWNRCIDEITGGIIND